MKNPACLNCEKEILPGAKYCNYCGQKHRKNLLSIRELFKEFFDNVINLDSTLFRSLLTVWAPANLAKKYVSGKRVRYFNPYRLLFLGLVIHVATIAFVLRDTRVDTISQSFYEDVDQSKMLKSMDEFLDTTRYQCNIPLADSIKSTVFKGVIHPEKDTLDFADLSFLNFDSISITKTDLMELSVDSLYKKAEVTKLYDKMVLKQLKRAVINPNGVFNAMISNLLWVGLFMIFISAMVFKFLYVRSNIFYVEHVVVLIYYHVAVWLALSIAFIATILFSGANDPMHWVALVVMGLSIPYLYLTMLIYYKQGIFKTLLKLMVFSTMYVMILSAITGLIVFVSFFIF